MKRAVAILVISAMLGAATPCAWAQQGGKVKTVYFEALYDVPAMPGLAELKDQAMLFDKPDGRIASVAAVSQSLTGEEISRFYAETLPQLGWRKTAQNQYVRGADRLSIEIKGRPPATTAQFTLAPNKS